MPSNIKVILFDADGVIQRSTRDFFPTLTEVVEASKRKTNLFTRLYKAVGANTPAAQHFIKDVIAAEQPCMVSSLDFPNELQKVLDNWQINIPLNEIMQLWGKITIYEEISDTITALQAKGYACGLATNQQSYRTNVMRKDLDYDSLFDHSFYSCEMGVKKPDTKYFEYIISTLNIPAPQLLFIDDKESNISAAKQVGLQAFSFDAAKTSLPAKTLLEKLSDYDLKI